MRKPWLSIGALCCVQHNANVYGQRISEVVRHFPTFHHIQLHVYYCDDLSTEQKCLYYLSFKNEEKMYHLYHIYVSNLKSGDRVTVCSTGWFLLISTPSFQTSNWSVSSPGVVFVFSNACRLCALSGTWCESNEEGASSPPRPCCLHGAVWFQHHGQRPAAWSWKQQCVVLVHLNLYSSYISCCVCHSLLHPLTRIYTVCVEEMYKYSKTLVWASI